MEKIDVPLIIDEDSEEAPQMAMPEMNHDTRKDEFCGSGTGLQTVKMPLKKHAAVCVAMRPFNLYLQNDKEKYFMSTVKLTIDNRKVKQRRGSTILEAARSAGIKFPHFAPGRKEITLRAPAVFV
jgi:hypothetical protein